jgi:hypothetical protein
VVCFDAMLAWLLLAPSPPFEISGFLHLKTLETWVSLWLLLVRRVCMSSVWLLGSHITHRGSAARVLVSKKIKLKAFIARKALNHGKMPGVRGCCSALVTMPFKTSASFPCICSSSATRCKFVDTSHGAHSRSPSATGGSLIMSFAELFRML